MIDETNYSLNSHNRPDTVSLMVNKVYSHSQHHNSFMHKLSTKIGISHYGRNLYSQSQFN